MPTPTSPLARRARSVWRSAIPVALAACVALGVISCSTTSRGSASPAAATSAAVAPAAYVYPGADWERIADPASVGWSRAGLDSVRARLSTMQTTGFMAVVGGRVLFEYGDITQQSYLASIRKSVLSMLYGIAQAKGEVNLDRTLAQIGIDDIGGLTDAEKEA